MHSAVPLLSLISKSTSSRFPLGPVLFIFSSHHSHSHSYSLLSHLFCFSAAQFYQYININPLKRNKLFAVSHLHQLPPLVFAANIQGVIYIHYFHLFLSHSLLHPLCFFLWSLTPWILLCQGHQWSHVGKSTGQFSVLIILGPSAAFWHNSSLPMLQYTFFTCHPSCLSACFLFSVHHLCISFAGVSYSNLLRLGNTRVQFWVLLCVSAHSFSNNKGFYELKYHWFLDLLVTPRFVILAQTSL